MVSRLMRRLTSQVYRPGRLDPAARRALIDAIYPLHRQVFAGIDRAEFEAYVLEPGTPHRWLVVVRAGDSAVGYSTVHVRDLVVNGAPIRLVRGAGGLLPAHRKQGAPILSRFVAARCSWAMLTAQGRPTWFAGAIMSPASHRMVATMLSGMSPRPERPPSPEMTHLLHGVADAIGMPPSITGDPGVRRAGWTVHFSDAARARIAASTDPTTRYFLKRNPHFADGEGIVFLAPVTVRQIASTVVQIGADQLSRRLRRAR